MNANIKPTNLPLLYHQSDSQANKQEEEQKQVLHKSIFCKGMHRTFSQNPAAGKKAGVQYQDEGQHTQKDSHKVSFFSFKRDQQLVVTGQQDQPGHQGGIFHRVPGPESAKTQRFISPGTTHQNTSSQGYQACHRPANRRTDPTLIILLNYTSQCQRERKQRKCESGKQYRGVDHHPVVLQQGIKPHAILEG